MLLYKYDYNHGEQLCKDILLSQNKGDSLDGLNKELDDLTSIVEEYNKSKSKEEFIKKFDAFIESSKYVIPILKAVSIKAPSFSGNSSIIDPLKKYLLEKEKEMLQEYLSKIKKEKKKNKEKNKDKVNFNKQLYDELKTKGEAHILTLMYFIQKYLSNDTKKSKCFVCSKESFCAGSFSYFTLANVTNYSEFQRYDTCLKCNFYLFLSQYYPYPPFTPKEITIGTSKNKLSLFYSLLNSKNKTSLILFLEDSFEKFLRHTLINPEKDLEKNDLEIIFYREGNQSENNVVYGYGRFNMLSTLQEMYKQNKTSVKNFKSIFITGRLVTSSEVLLVPYIIQMLQNDDIPFEILVNHLHVLRENFKEKEIADFISLYYFLRDFYEVKKMYEENDALKRGYAIGKEILKILEEDSDSKKDSNINRIRAMTATMEMSESTFLDGILTLQREYQIPVNTYDLGEIANNREARINFLIGLMSGVLESKKTDKSETKSEEMSQEESQ
jgi:hypothetical protein